ncbi:hypothetical protein B0H13DRAFT_1876298 [Mycena leptocephala]|nr:hypothetical protein B0H13DRAFT_1876298 [Mycena leptocephala]
MYHCGRAPSLPQLIFVPHCERKAATQSSNLPIWITSPVNSSIIEIINCALRKPKGMVVEHVILCREEELDLDGRYGEGYRFGGHERLSMRENSQRDRKAFYILEQRKDTRVWYPSVVLELHGNLLRAGCRISRLAPMRDPAVNACALLRGEDRGSGGRESGGSWSIRLSSAGNGRHGAAIPTAPAKKQSTATRSAATLTEEGCLVLGAKKNGRERGKGRMARRAWTTDEQT